MWLFIEPLAMLKRMCPPPAPRSLALIRGRLIGVGDEVGIEQQPLLLAAVGEVVALAGETVLEVVGRVEDEIRVAEGVDDRRRVGHRDEARRLGAASR